MRQRRCFLILAALLALAWTAWLGYETFTTADPIVVSRPQLLVAPIIVEVELDASGESPRPARVVKIYRGQAELGVGDMESEPENLRIKLREVPNAAGSFLLALRSTGERSEFEVVPIPQSPGFRSAAVPNRAPTYPATTSTRAQVREILRQYHGAMP